MNTQGYVNHIGMVLDMSLSMSRHHRQLVTVADGQVQHLARRSKELDQETRVTIYTFNNNVECVVYDKDVLRLPSISSFYRPNGATALRDATMTCLDDLAMTPEKYGDHAFLIYVLTDGEENRSRLYTDAQLNRRITTLPDHWTVASLVPDALAKHEAKQVGFPADNIAVWNADSASGVTEIGATIQQATESFMTGRASGLRGTRTLFSTSADALNAQTVAAAGLTPLPAHRYSQVHIKAADRVPVNTYIKDELGLKFRMGSVYYQLTKPEKIQANKNVLVQNKKTKQVYEGKQARDLLGLPDMEVRVKPDANPEFNVFIQSNSTNRLLIPETELLILNP
jgi:hypothetical protein